MTNTNKSVKQKINERLNKPYEPTEYEKRLLEQKQIHDKNANDKDECEKMKEGSTLDPKYVDAALSMWRSGLDMMSYASNKLGAIYTLGSLLRIFAKGRVYIEELGRQFAEAKEKQDVDALKSIIKKVDFAQDKKALSYLWDIVSDEYSKVVCDYSDTCTNDDIVLSIPAPEKILKQCYQSVEDAKNTQFQQALATAESFLKF